MIAYFLVKLKIQRRSQARAAFSNFYERGQHSSKSRKYETQAADGLYERLKSMVEEIQDHESTSADSDESTRVPCPETLV